MYEKICRLCLQTTTENHHPVGESLKNTLKLNINISNEPVTCIECANNIELFLKLKSSCECVESKSESKCCFCTKTSGREGLTSINESKEYTFLLGVLKEHIPKLNLNMTKELLTCETCLDQLKDVFSFIKKCLDVEQQINKYTELKGTDDKGQIELGNVQEFLIEQTIKCEIVPKPVDDLGERYDQFQEKRTIQTKAEIKHEEEIESPEIFMKTNIDIKLEHDDGSDSSQELFASSTIIGGMDNGSLDMLKIPLQIINKTSINQLTHKNRSRMTKYVCELCPYETKKKYCLNQHKLIHQSMSEITMFKCGLCSFETKHQRCIKRHELTHKSTSEVKMFKCELCPFQTKYRHCMKKHNLIHKSTTEVTMFKCEQCSYRTKHRSYIKQHELSHKSSLETTMYKCELCLYKSKYRSNIKQHQLTHKSTLEVTMFKCELCSFQTKHQSSIKQHVLTHKNISEVV